MDVMTGCVAASTAPSIRANRLALVASSARSKLNRLTRLVQSEITVNGQGDGQRDEWVRAGALPVGELAQAAVSSRVTAT